MDIFLDLDGVCADFLSASMHVDEWSDLFHAGGVKESEIYSFKFYELAGIETSEWQDWINKSDENFWSDLPLTRDAERIVETVEHYDNSFKFLSHAVNDGARVGKRCWIRSKLQRPSTNLICVDEAEDKARLATGPNCVLIDDLPENVRQWTDAGGVGILWGQKWNVGENVGYPVAHSVDELNECLLAIQMAEPLTEMFSAEEPVEVDDAIMKSPATLEHMYSETDKLHDELASLNNKLRAVHVMVKDILKILRG